MAVTITYADGSTLTVDASLKQTYEVRNEVTDHPVETGSNVTDDIRAKPRCYVLEGVVSATPIIAPGDTPQANRHVSAYAKMDAAAAARETVAVSSGLRNYPIMAIESLTVPREPKTGIDFYFTLHLKEIVFATSATATVPKVNLQAGAVRNMASPISHRGKRQTTLATASQKTAAGKAVKGAAHKPQPRAATASWAVGLWNGITQ